MAAAGFGVTLYLAGGGSAGLNLAQALLQSPLRERSLLIVDQDPKDTNDRTWCSWLVGSPSLRTAVVCQLGASPFYRRRLRRHPAARALSLHSMMALGVGVRALTAAFSRQRVRDALGLPISVILMAVIASQAIYWRVRYGGVRWKGRTLPT